MLNKRSKKFFDENKTVIIFVEIFQKELMYINKRRSFLFFQILDI